MERTTAIHEKQMRRGRVWIAGRGTYPEPHHGNMAHMDTATLRLTDAERGELARLGVVLCYLHGSVAQGVAQQDSDVDVAVLFDEMPEDVITITGSLLQTLERFARGRELDVAILNEASPLFRQAVASRGCLLYSRSPDDALKFELRSMHDYEYSRPVARLGQKLALERAGL